jgi:hypothetical protein
MRTKGASLKQAALAWDTKDADPDDASQRAVTDGDDDDDDDEEALEDEVTLASDPDHTPAHDPARQPAIDDDEHELTLASDREGTHADPAQQPAIDDDDESIRWTTTSMKRWRTRRTANTRLPLMP